MEKFKNPRSKNDSQENSKTVHILKALLISYILTGGMLLLLALLLYKLSLSEGIVSICIIAIYVIASFVAGNYTGRQMDSRKFIWGLVMGGAYFIVLALISLIVNHSLKDVATNFFTVMALCMAGGMLGGMYSNMR